MWDGKLIRESTKQGNDKVARQMEAAHRVSLAKGEVGIREKKPTPTLSEFCSKRIEPWAKIRPSWQWYRSGIRPLLAYRTIACAKLDGITSESIADYVGHRLLVTEGKTAAARRALPLTPRVRIVLEARWNVAGKPSEGYVWPAPTKSGHIDHSTLKKAHTRALKLSGVRHFVLYSLRHTFATRIAPHVDAWTLCKIMGWAS